MENRGFVDFSIKRCIKVNIITSVIFVIMVRLMLFISQIIYEIEDKKFVESGVDNGSLDILFVFGFLVMFIVMIIYSIIVPMVIRMYKNFYYNLISLIGIIICNVLVAVFLYYLCSILVFPLIYLALVLGGIFINLTFKYSNTKMKEITTEI